MKIVHGQILLASVLMITYLIPTIQDIWDLVSCATVKRMSPCPLLERELR